MFEMPSSKSSFHVCEELRAALPLANEHPIDETTQNLLISLNAISLIACIFAAALHLFVMRIFVSRPLFHGNHVTLVLNQFFLCGLVVGGGIIYSAAGALDSTVISEFAAY